MESDGLGLYFTFLNIDFVAGKDDRNVFANTNQVTYLDTLSLIAFQHSSWEKLTMPVRDVLVCDTRSNIEHDDTTLSVDVIPITETSKFLLSSSIPDVELDVSQVLLISVSESVSE